jgi:hypothetical protein
MAPVTGICDGVIKPLTILIPHQLGRDATIARLKTGLQSVRRKFGPLVSFEQETWTGNRLDLCLAALGQRLDARLEVLDDSVRLEIILPWFLAGIAGLIEPVVRKEAALLLERK